MLTVMPSVRKISLFFQILGCAVKDPQVAIKAIWMRSAASQLDNKLGGSHRQYRIE